MKETILHTRAAWSAALNDNPFRWQFILTLTFFFAVSQHNFHFLNLWESREGMMLHDPIMNMLPPRDFSNIIFFFTYGSILFVMVSSLPNPGLLVRGVQAYALIVMLRTASIYFFPLETPPGYVGLTDPVTDFFLNKQVVVTKDLFFSGHTATIAFMFLMAQNRYLKIFCGIAVLVVPPLLVWQHVHYTVDVVAAPVVSYCVIKLVDWVNHNYEYGKVLYRY